MIVQEEELTGVIQMTSVDQEGKKEKNLMTKQPQKEPDVQKTPTPSSFLETLPSTPVDPLEVQKHVIHSFLLHESMSMEDALESVERSLSSREKTVRLLAEIQIRENCVLVNGRYALSPAVLATLSLSDWIWNESEQATIAQHFPTPKRKRSKVEETQPIEEPKQRRTRKQKPKPEGEVEKELTLTIPNHILSYDESLLSRDLRDAVQRNRGMFTTYRSQVENDAME